MEDVRRTVTHKADLLAMVVQSPVDFLPQIATEEWKALRCLNMYLYNILYI